MADKVEGNPEIEAAEKEAREEEAREEKPRKRKARTAPPPVEEVEPDDLDPILDLDDRVTDLEEYRMARKAPKADEGEGFPWKWIAIAGVVLVALVLGERFKSQIAGLIKRNPAPPPVAP